MVHLLKDFYRNLNLTSGNGQVISEIELNEHHSIFEGHFPEMPVVPGVCQMQIVREILSEVLSEKIYLSSAENIKFLAIINPLKNKRIFVKLEYTQIDYEKLKVNSRIYFEDRVFFKCTCTFKKII